MAEWLQWIIRIGVILLMVLVGTECAMDRCRAGFRRPGLLAVVVLGQFVVVPAAVFACCRLLRLPPEVAGSLLLFACCPAGSISNTHCLLARGNVSLSVTLTLLSCLVAVVATPLALSGVHDLLGTTTGTSGLPLIPPGRLVRELVLSMLLPLMLGMLLRSRRPEWIESRRGAVRAASLGLVIALIVVVISTDPREVLRQARVVALAAGAATGILVIVGLGIARGFGLPEDDTWAVVFELPCRNLAIAALVAVNVLGIPELAQFGAAFFVIQSGLLLVVTAAGRRRRPRRAGHPTPSMP